MTKLHEQFRQALARDPKKRAAVEKWAANHPDDYDQFIEDLQRRDREQFGKAADDSSIAEMFDRIDGDGLHRDPADYKEASEFDAKAFYALIEPEVGYQERGNPQVGFDEASDQMLLFFFWLVTGSHKGTDGYDIPRNTRLSLENPAIIGRRVIAAVYTLHPYILEGRSLQKLAKMGGTSRQNLSDRVASFFEHFPVFKNRINHGNQSKKYYAMKAARKTESKRGDNLKSDARGLGRGIKAARKQTAE